MNIVLADDSDMILMRLQEMLSHIGFVSIVGISKNGKDALKMIIEKKPDLAIVDIKMPEMNGLDVLKEVRKTNKNLKFIILTFYVLEQYKKIAFDTGVNYFLSKADDFDKIEDIVRGCNLGD